MLFLNFNFHAMRSFFFSLLLLIFACHSGNPPAPSTTAKDMQANQEIDWQGHRGARGLLPENTIPAFLKALEYPVKTLELDVAVS